MHNSKKSCVRVQSLTEYFYEHFKGLPKGIIFDCDGVLIDSVEANMSFYNRLRLGLGLPELNEEQRDYCQMSTVNQAFDHIVPKALHSQISVVMKDISYVRDIEPLIDISENLLPFLKKFNTHCLMGVHTNRMNKIDDMLTRLGMGDIFDPIVTVERAEAKPSPDGTFQILKEWKLDPTQVLFIGDSKADKEAAYAAGVHFLSYRNPKLQENGTCCDFNDLSEAFSLFLDGEKNIIS